MSIFLVCKKIIYLKFQSIIFKFITYNVNHLYFYSEFKPNNRVISMRLHRRDIQMKSLELPTLEKKVPLQYN